MTIQPAAANFLGWLLGLPEVESIEQVRFRFGSAWAGEFPLLLAAGLFALLVATVLFYLLAEKRRHWLVRLGLAGVRWALLALLLITLANPVVLYVVSTVHKPRLFLVFDGTDSMNIEDDLPPQEAGDLAAAVGADGGSDLPRSRADFVRAWIARKENNIVHELEDRRGVHVETFVFDGESTSRLRKISGGPAGEPPDPQKLAAGMTATGEVTAIGSVLEDVARQYGTGSLAGVVIVSDFVSNAGAAPLGDGSGETSAPASRLGVPVYTVGVGALEATDLAVGLQTDPKMKKAERTNVLVKLDPSGLAGQVANVRVFARRLSGGGGGAAEIPIGERLVSLSTDIEIVEFPFTPQDAGRFEFVAVAEPIGGEVVTENNRAMREVNIIDDYLRLMYVEYEPTWEWRFIKEVFHRDKLVGVEGFRTYLASSDPRVRETNVLFLPTLTPKRSDFFANDVIFLGDMPGGALNDRFAQMVKEFVSDFGGGLVVIAGPRFGPRELAGTPLADMLPIVPGGDSRLYGDGPDDRPFALQLTGDASRYSFMQLGETAEENRSAWDNLSRLPWFQPSAGKHEQAVVLAAHPTMTCADGRTPQPLIAIRPYGKGEVVYLAFNETWRLRRKYGDQYYRQFWSQLIYRLGMSHALGSEKRFVVRTDRQQYRAEEKVILTVEGYDANFEPLGEDAVPGGALTAELVGGGEGGVETSRPVAVPMLRGGVYETRIPVYAAGEYRLRVKDPVTGQYSEVAFDVSEVSAERRRPERDAATQEAIARETGGKSYTLVTADNLLRDVKAEPLLEETHLDRPLWATPLWFGLVVGLMLSEWLLRKLGNMS